MRKIGVAQLKPGVALGRNLYSDDGRLLLAQGTVIEESYLQSMLSKGIEFVYLKDEESSTRKHRKSFSDTYAEALEAIRGFMTETKLGRPLPQDEVEETVNSLVELVFDEVDIFKQMRIMHGKDSYLFTHSVNVGLLCILISRWLKCSKKEIKKAGLAGIFHDLGKVYISNDILLKPGKLTDEEFIEVKKHSQLGYNAITQNEWIPDDVANGILMHHERLDGSGYPMGVSSTGLNYLARLVAVADIYDAITSNRVYSRKESPYAAAEILWNESFGKLDGRIAKVFYDRVSSFYIGNRVVLSNGEVGTVVFVDPGLPTRPIVQVGEMFYDLRERHVTITEIVD
ncbi:MAG: HD-GYP domain-containing protein [Chitinophagales bacterium]